MVNNIREHETPLLSPVKEVSTINDTYYASLVRQLQEHAKLKYLGKFSKVLFFYQDYGPAHKSAIAKSAMTNSEFILIELSPYSSVFSLQQTLIYTNGKKKQFIA